MIEFRQATANDEVACLLLYAIGQREAPEAYEGASKDALLAAIERGDVTVADKNGEVVGMVTKMPAGEVDWIGMLVVNHESRHGQLAPTLIEAARTRSDKKTMSIVAPHALRSFEAAGFERKGFLVTHA